MVEEKEGSRKKMKEYFNGVSYLFEDFKLDDHVLKENGVIDNQS